MSFTIGDVFDDAQGLLNDVAAATYTDARLTPLVKIAHRELKDRLNACGHQTTLEKATATIAAGATTYGTLPTGFAFPHKMEERASGGTDDDYIPMIPAIVEPPRDGGALAVLQEWVFRGYSIYFVAASQDREVRLWYWGRFLPIIVDGTTAVSQEQFQNYLMYRTAALAARVIGEDTERAADLNAQASAEMDLIMSAIAKNEQNLRVVRPPRRRRF